MPLFFSRKWRISAGWTGGRVVEGTALEMCKSLIRSRPSKSKSRRFIAVFKLLAPSESVEFRLVSGKLSGNQVGCGIISRITSPSRNGPLRQTRGTAARAVAAHGRSDHWGATRARLHARMLRPIQTVTVPIQRAQTEIGPNASICGVWRDAYVGSESLPLRGRKKLRRQLRQ